jgi:hypothetical protein
MAGSLLPSVSSCANKGAKPARINKNKPTNFFITVVFIWLYNFTGVSSKFKSKYVDLLI